MCVVCQFVDFNYFVFVLSHHESKLKTLFFRTCVEITQFSRVTVFSGARTCEDSSAMIEAPGVPVCP